MKTYVTNLTTGKLFYVTEEEYHERIIQEMIDQGMVDPDELENNEVPYEWLGFDTLEDSLLNRDYATVHWLLEVALDDIMEDFDYLARAENCLKACR